jgi:uncharacterized repeat protein (TIGR03803 family)
MGVIFKIRPNGTEYQVLVHLTSWTGRYPEGGLTRGNDGYLYGTTNETLYKVKPDGSNFQVLFRFGGAETGQYPHGEVMIENGAIYGMTNSGGAYAQGLIYRIMTDGNGFVKLHEFNEPIAANPTGTLASDGKGNLYGMTPYGGYESLGNIFTIKTDGTGYKVLFEFSNAASGFYPFGKLLVTEDTFAPVQSTVGVAETESPVSVYPNPTADAFTVARTTSEESEMSLELTDFTGAVVYQSRVVNGQDVKLGQELPKGIYILKVYRNDKVIQHRLVKK